MADAPADCVGGLCESIEGSSLVWSFDVPNDLPQLDYYISVEGKESRVLRVRYILMSQIGRAHV